MLFTWKSCIGGDVKENIKDKVSKLLEIIIFGEDKDMNSDSFFFLILTKI